MIGAIADDFTGATDVAVAFRRSGLRVAIVFGDQRDVALPESDVVVVALKSRTVDPSEAVRQSLEAAAWLEARGASQFYFKYCSTFDSRAEGNIGPVSDALMDALGATRAVFAPSSPEHLRTQYMGHLFVDRQLLSDSPMRHHPLTPMTNSFIPDVLAAQTTRSVGLIDHRTVRRGSTEIAAELSSLQDGGHPYVVVDAVTDDDLAEIGRAVASDRLVTGAAGLAGGLGAAIARRIGRAEQAPGEGDPVGAVTAAALAGSCSARTLEQVARMSATHPSLRLDAVQTPDPERLSADALRWYDAQSPGDAPLIYSSLPPEDLRRTQEILGSERASSILETAMGLIARGLVERGVRRLVVAGGETSGAVVTALGIRGGVIGDEAAPGVPWIYTTDSRSLALLLKSGNFGDPELLTTAVEGRRHG
jgi:Uncharacterized protein conserved in bacteria